MTNTFETSGLLDIVRKALAVAEERASDPEYPWWIDVEDCAEHVNVEGDEFCEECAKKELAQLLSTSAEYVGAFVKGGAYGGWGHEDDHPRWCETCGKLLNKSLITPENELDGWSESLYDLGDPDSWFILAEIFRWAEEEINFPGHCERAWRRQENANLVLRSAFLAEWALAKIEED